MKQLAFEKQKKRRFYEKFDKSETHERILGLCPVSLRLERFRVTKLTWRINGVPLEI